MDVTLFELHVDDASLSASSPFGSRGEEESEPESGGGGPGRLLAVVAALAIAGIALWVVRNGTPETVPTPKGDIPEARQ